MYPVSCTCGRVQEVPPTLAGGRVPCACGLELAVPSLSALKASQGQSAMSAEVRIKQMLERRMLPEETQCLLCRTVTSNVCHCWTTCERPRVEQPTGWGLSSWTHLSL